MRLKARCPGADDLSVVINEERVAATPPGEARPARGRRADRPLGALRRVLRGSSRAPSVVLGQHYVGACAAVFLLTVPMLRPSVDEWWAVAAAASVMLAALLASLRLPWHRLPVSATLALPATPLTVLAVLGITSDLSAPYGGLWALGFTVTGLTQGARANAMALVPATVLYVMAIGTFTAAFGVRVIIVAAVWVLVSQLLVRLTLEQRQVAGDLRTEAHTDALTGLANRRHLDRRLEHLEVGDSVVICDLDHFKALNDRWGHVAGDRVLSDVGMLLRVGLRDGDYAARYGGEEFALVLPATSTAQAGAVTDRLRQRWATLQPGTTFSAGVATMTGDVEARAVVVAADAALYEAKAAGRNCTRGAPAG